MLLHCTDGVDAAAALVLLPRCCWQAKATTVLDLKRLTQLGIGLAKQLPKVGNMPDIAAICSAISTMQGAVVEELARLSVLMACLPTEADTNALKVRAGRACQCMSQACLHASHHV